MTVSLLETARNNRIEALEYLEAKRSGADASGELFDLSAIRARQKAKPMFFSCRASQDEDRIAA